MARIKLGGLAQDVRGSLNGTTFSRNKGGAYVRTRVSPVQPRTFYQLRQRSIFATNAKAWSQLTDSQRTAWTAFAAANPLTNVFGDSIIVSGLAAYQQLNAVLLTIGQPVISDPPADKTVIPIAAAVGMLSSSTGPLITNLEIGTDAQATSATTDYYVFATSVLQPGINPSKSAYRFIGAYSPVAAATAVNILTEYTAKFGSSTATGKKIWAIVAQVSTDSGAVTVGQKFATVF
jgi:hypothetical protein